MSTYLKRVPKWVWWALAALVGFQIYFLRELAAAELLFAIAFAALLIFVSVVYWIAVGADRGLGWIEANSHGVTDRALGWIEANSHGVTERARHQWERLEAVSKKLSHRQHSESAQ